MVRIIAIIIELFICLLLQTSVFSYFVISGVMPDILIILVISVAYTKGRNQAIIVGFFSGFLLDIVSSGNIGISSIIYMIIAFLAGYSNKLYAKFDYVIPNALIASGELAFCFLSYLTGFFLQGNLALKYLFFNTMVPRTVYTFLVGLILYPIFHIIHRLLLKVEGIEDRDFTNT